MIFLSLVYMVDYKNEKKTNNPTVFGLLDKSSWDIYLKA